MDGVAACRWCNGHNRNASTNALFPSAWLSVRSTAIRAKSKRNESERGIFAIDTLIHKRIGMLVRHVNRWDRVQNHNRFKFFFPKINNIRGQIVMKTNNNWLLNRMGRMANWMERNSLIRLLLTRCVCPWLCLTLTLKSRCSSRRHGLWRPGDCVRLSTSLMNNETDTVRLSAQQTILHGWPKGQLTHFDFEDEIRLISLPLSTARRGWIPVGFELI